jgi:hypothetical protein
MVRAAGTISTTSGLKACPAQGGTGCPRQAALYNAIVHHRPQAQGPDSGPRLDWFDDVA